MNYRTIYIRVLAGCLHSVEYFFCRFLYFELPAVVLSNVFRLIKPIKGIIIIT